MTTRMGGDDATARGTPIPGDVPAAGGQALERAMRDASDGFLARVERMHALEERKREVPADQIEGLAAEIQALAEEVLGWASEQRRLAESAADPGVGDLRPIADVPPRTINEILSEWRAAERRLQTIEKGSEAYASAQADGERLRKEYARAYSLHSKGPARDA